MKVDLLGLKPCLEDHDKPVTVAFMIIDILENAEYSKEEIQEFAAFITKYYTEKRFQP